MRVNFRGGALGVSSPFEFEALERRYLMSVAVDLGDGFGRMGALTETLAPHEIREGLKLVVQPDGKLLAVAETAAADGTWDLTTLVLARFHPDGKPDTAFGHGGRVIVEGHLSLYTWDQPVIVQPDGKILVWGSDDLQSSYIGRFNSNGSWDHSFGDGGRLNVSLPLTTGTEPASPYDVGFRLTAALPQHDGGVLLVGNRGGMRSSINMVRLTAQGQLDPTFGQLGEREIVGHAAHAAFGAFQTGPARVIVGIDDEHTGVRFDGFDSQGQLDAAFSTVQFADDVWDDAVTQMADGRLVVWRDDLAAPRFSEGWLERYTTDGRPDPTFGGTGRVRVDSTYYSPLRPLVAQDGSVILVFYARAADDDRSLAIMRFHADGTPDSTFGEAGVAIIEFEHTDAHIMHAATLLSDGGVLIHGEAGWHDSKDGLIREWGQMYLIRIRPDGRSVDTGFGPEQSPAATPTPEEAEQGPDEPRVLAERLDWRWPFDNATEHPDEADDEGSALWDDEDELDWDTSLAVYT